MVEQRDKSYHTPLDMLLKLQRGSHGKALQNADAMVSLQKSQDDYQQGCRLCCVVQIMYRCHGVFSSLDECVCVWGGGGGQVL